MKNGLFSSHVRIAVAVFCILLPIIALWVTRRTTSSSHRTDATHDTASRTEADAGTPPPLTSRTADTVKLARMNKPPPQASTWVSLQEIGLTIDAPLAEIRALLSGWELQNTVKDGAILVLQAEADLVSMALRLDGLEATQSAWTLDDVTASPVDTPRLYRMQTWLAGRDTLARMLPLAFGVEDVHIRISPSIAPYDVCAVRVSIPEHAYATLSADDHARIRQHVESLLAPVASVSIEMHPTVKAEDAPTTQGTEE